MTRTEPAAFSTEDHRWMRRALALAEKAFFLSNPNPRVGCVLVRDGRWVAEGHTQQAGGRHAEAEALHAALQAGIDVAGATAYVSLEPCSHYGRTPPCADALIAAGLRRVVVGLRDPNPRVAGRGIERLRAAGIQVDVGLLAGETLRQNPGFCARMTRATPWVRLKSAQTLDGYMALPDGRSQWITGPQAREDGHRWRAQACVVLTGIGTVRADDPRLTVREVATPRQPVRAVLDSRLTLSEDARMIDGGALWVFTTRDDPAKARRLAARNVQVIVLPADKAGHVDLKALLSWLAAHEINEVHVEAGGRLQGALVAADLVDEWIAYVAPKVIGAGQPLAQLPRAVDNLDEAYAFEFQDGVQLGRDMRLRLRQATHWATLMAACGVPPMGER